MEPIKFNLTRKSAFTGEQIDQGYFDNKKQVYEKAKALHRLGFDGEITQHMKGLGWLKILEFFNNEPMPEL